VGCHISQARAAWTSAPRPGQIGLVLTANGARGSQVTEVSVSDFQVDNAYSGIYAQPAAACRVSFAADGVRITRPAQYGMILFASAVAVRGGDIEAAAGFPALALFSNDGDSGGAVAISGLTLSGEPGRAALIEIGVDGDRPAAFTALAIQNTVGHGGRALLSARLTGPAGGPPTQVALKGNSALDLAGPVALDLRFAEGVTAQVAALRNRFATRAGVPAQMRIGPRAAILSSRLAGNQAEVTIT
jgi:hypothetical protein